MPLMISRYEIQDKAPMTMVWPESTGVNMHVKCTIDFFSAFDNHYRTMIARWVVQAKLFQPHWPYSGCYIFPTCKQFLGCAAQSGWEAGLYAWMIHCNSERHLVHCQNLQAPLRVFKDNIVGSYHTMFSEVLNISRTVLLRAWETPWTWPPDVSERHTTTKQHQTTLGGTNHPSQTRKTI
jgi:hypothetical protein